jgi:hypothetical protein
MAAFYSSAQDELSDFQDMLASFILCLNSLVRTKKT